MKSYYYFILCFAFIGMAMGAEYDTAPLPSELNVEVVEGKVKRYRCVNTDCSIKLEVKYETQ